MSTDLNRCGWNANRQRRWVCPGEYSLCEQHCDAVNLLLCYACVNCVFVTRLSFKNLRLFGNMCSLYNSSKLNADLSLNLPTFIIVDTKIETQTRMIWLHSHVLGTRSVTRMATDTGSCSVRSCELFCVFRSSGVFSQKKLIFNIHIIVYNF